MCREIKYEICCVGEFDLLAVFVKHRGLPETLVTEASITGSIWTPAFKILLTVTIDKLRLNWWMRRELLIRKFIFCMCLFGEALL